MRHGRTVAKQMNVDINHKERGYTVQSTERGAVFREREGDDARRDTLIHASCTEV